MSSESLSAPQREVLEGRRPVLIFYFCDQLNPSPCLHPMLSLDFCPDWPQHRQRRSWRTKLLTSEALTKNGLTVWWLSELLQDTSVVTLHVFISSLPAIFSQSLVDVLIYPCMTTPRVWIPNIAFFEVWRAFLAKHSESISGLKNYIYILVGWRSGESADSLPIVAHVRFSVSASYVV